MQSAKGEQVGAGAEEEETERERVAGELLTTAKKNCKCNDGGKRMKKEKLNIRQT